MRFYKLRAGALNPCSCLASSPLVGEESGEGYHPHPNLLPSREKALRNVLPKYQMFYPNADKTPDY